MQFETFTEKTLPKKSGGRSGSPRISLNKSGVIVINGVASKMMKIKAGDKLILACDKKDNKNWYVSKNPEGYELRLGYDKKSVMFNHSLLIQKILTACDKEADVTYSFLIAGQPTLNGNDKDQYWGILIP